MNKLKSILKNPWVFSISYTVIAGIILKLIDLITGSSIIPWVFNKILIFLKLFNKQIHINIKIWILLIIIVLIYILIHYRKKIISIETIDPEVERMKNIIKNYYTDEFDGIPYRWIVKFDAKIKQYHFEDIAALCPKCGCMLVYSKCPNCRDGINYYIKDVNELGVLIRYRLEQKIAQ